MLSFITKVTGRLHITNQVAPHGESLFAGDTEDVVATCTLVSGDLSLTVK